MQATGALTADALGYAEARKDPEVFAELQKIGAAATTQHRAGVRQVFGPTKRALERAKLKEAKVVSAQQALQEGGATRNRTPVVSLCWLRLRSRRPHMCLL